MDTAITIPAGAILLGVSARVVSAIAGATAWRRLAQSAELPAETRRLVALSSIAERRFATRADLVQWWQRLAAQPEWQIGVMLDLDADDVARPGPEPELLKWLCKLCIASGLHRVRRDATFLLEPEATLSAAAALDSAGAEASLGGIFVKMVERAKARSRR